MKYLYKQTGIVVESDDVLDSTMFKPIIEEKTEDLIEDSETETGVAEAPLIIVSPAKTNELYGLGVTEVTTTGYKLTAYSPKQGMCYVQADMLIIGKWK